MYNKQGGAMDERVVGVKHTLDERYLQYHSHATKDDFSSVLLQLIQHEDKGTAPKPDAENEMFDWVLNVGIINTAVTHQHLEKLTEVLQDQQKPLEKPNSQEALVNHTASMGILNFMPTNQGLEKILEAQLEYTHSEKKALFPTLKNERSMLKDYSNNSHTIIPSSALETENALLEHIQKDRRDDNLSVKDAKTYQYVGKPLENSPSYPIHLLKENTLNSLNLVEKFVDVKEIKFSQKEENLAGMLVDTSRSESGKRMHQGHSFEVGEQETTDFTHFSDKKHYSTERKIEEKQDGENYKNVSPYQNVEVKGLEKGVEQELKTQSVKKHQATIGYEPKHVSLWVEEANARLTFLGDRLKLFINLDDNLYRQPTALEVQRLVQSLQSMGINLEVLKLNGNSLYSSDNRQGERKEERGKTVPAFLEEEVNSFSLYL